MIEAVQRFWQERGSRERLALLAGAALALLALLYWLLIEPPVTGIAQLQRALPTARTQAAQLDALLAEAKGLRARPRVATVGPGEARVAIEKSLASAGLKAARIVPLADGDVQMTFANVPYAGWATWLAGAERELGAHATSVLANATATPGNADVELALRLARR